MKFLCKFWVMSTLVSRFAVYFILCESWELKFTFRFKTNDIICAREAGKYENWETFFFSSILFSQKFPVAEQVFICEQFFFLLLFVCNSNHEIWDKFSCKKLNGFHVDGDDDADRQTSARENLGRPVRICRKTKHVKQWWFFLSLCLRL